MERQPRDPFNNPGNVSGVRWGSGTMIGDDLFLTCGHLFDDNANGWMLPRDNATGDVVTPAEKAANMHLNFNFQEDAGRQPPSRAAVPDHCARRVPDQRPGLRRLPDRWQSGCDLRRAAVSIEDAAVNDMICIIGHPAGMPKRIEAGPTTADLTATRSATTTSTRWAATPARASCMRTPVRWSGSTPTAVATTPVPAAIPACGSSDPARVAHRSRHRPLPVDGSPAMASTPANTRPPATR